ncbi:peroxiredoxin [Knoellia subterranea]|uniref:Alkyl hydroperoxide reductase E n=1 Tax=Knoellia subterranea KCTC 19937 TaxID=1385521 RepID=A0A0A0JPF6_9MICO|nr:peroxiredoxin [Knoellia subterranea]KGN38998.1 peroxiredoxin [Knoellia subterranea KCTC 19937]
MTDPGTALAVGDRAPLFTLRDQNGADVALTDVLAQRQALIVFYPWAFSGICTGELTEIRDDLGSFVTDDVQVLTISCDAMFSLRAYADRDGYFFPLLSDFWPHGEVARAYGVFDEEVGVARRGTFLIDRDGIIRWSLISGIGERRDFSGFHAALARA